MTLNNSPASCDLRSETSFVVGTGDSTPSVSVPPIVYCQGSAVCTFAVPAADADGDTLRWRMSTSSEAGGTGQPTGMSVNATTGLVTWNTTGLATGLWAANVTVEELDGSSAVKGKTSADFILAVGSYLLPTFVAPTPANGTTFNLTQGDSFSLPLSVDAPSGQTVTLSSPRAAELALVLVSGRRCERVGDLHRHGPEPDRVDDRRLPGDVLVRAQLLGVVRDQCQPAPHGVRRDAQRHEWRERKRLAQRDEPGRLSAHLPGHSAGRPGHRHDHGRGYRRVHLRGRFGCDWD